MEEDELYAIESETGKIHLLPKKEEKSKMPRAYCGFYIQTDNIVEIDEVEVQDLHDNVCKSCKNQMERRNVHLVAFGDVYA